MWSIWRIGASQRRTAGLVDHEEPLQRRWERSCRRLDGDEIADVDIGIQTPERESELGVVLGLRGAEHLLARVLVGHGAEALDQRRIGMSGREQRTVRDHDADVEGGRVDAVRAPDQRVGEEVGHDLLVPATIALRTGALRRDAEPLADPGPVDPGDEGGDLCHPVIGAAHSHVTILLRGVMPCGGSLGVQGMEDLRGLIAPLQRPAPLESGEPGGEDLVDLAALLGGRRAHDGADLVGGLRDHPRVGQRCQHPGHAADQSSRGRERAASHGPGLLGALAASSARRGPPARLSSRRRQSS